MTCKITKIAIIQANYTDLIKDDYESSHYSIDALKKSKNIDEIIITAPDNEKNRIFHRLAEKWGVRCFIGDELDVIKRIIMAAETSVQHKDAIIVRVLLNRFYLDIDLVDNTIELLEDSKADYVIYPYDFDINFGGDVLTLNCLRKTYEIIDQKDSIRFRPWLFIEERQDLFKIVINRNVPSYPKEKLNEIRESGLFSERDCGTFSRFTYEFASQFISSSDSVLDIACGNGQGSSILSKKCKICYGGDLSPETIKEARENFGAPNINFDVMDICDLKFSGSFFNAIVTLNTLEHIEDEKLMLDNCYRVLVPGGSLILEVPLLKTRPFNFPILSSHIRE